jgi:hypothetical protein
LANAVSPAPRLLFVIDNDFGALATVMYFLHRQPLSAHALVLLPRRAYELQEGRLRVASRPYQSLQDILDAVEGHAPDAVCLFSGYLIACQDLLTIDSLRKLIAALRRRGCKVATSDPYLGTYLRIADTDVPAEPGGLERNLDVRLAKLPLVHGFATGLVRTYVGNRLKRELRAIAGALGDVTHIYPVPMEPAEVGGVKSLSFFNPLYIRSGGELRGNSGRWLFVLARFDLEFLEGKYGRQGFVDRVAGKIREALDNGKHPTFIGPAAIAQELSHRFPLDSEVELLSTCPFEDYERRLLDAEIVFFWQVFSSSAILRLWNGLQVYFFDVGHNARVLGPLREAGLKHYYLAAPPAHLDIDKPLNAAELAREGPAFRQSAEDCVKRLARLPTPVQMASAIMDAG